MSLEKDNRAYNDLSLSQIDGPTSDLQCNLGFTLTQTNPASNGKQNERLTLSAIQQNITCLSDPEDD